METTTTVVRSVDSWRRLGSEAEARDQRWGFAVRGGDLTDAELRAVLGDHYANDLSDPEICEDREAVLDALVDGYRNGG